MKIDQSIRDELDKVALYTYLLTANLETSLRSKGSLDSAEVKTLESIRSAGAAIKIAQIHYKDS